MYLRCYINNPPFQCFQAGLKYYRTFDLLHFLLIDLSLLFIHQSSSFLSLVVEPLGIGRSGGVVARRAPVLRHAAAGALAASAAVEGRQPLALAGGPNAGRGLFSGDEMPVRAPPKKNSIDFTRILRCIRRCLGGGVRPQEIQTHWRCSTVGVPVMSRLPFIEDPTCEPEIVGSYVEDRQEIKREAKERHAAKKLADQQLNTLRKKYAKERGLFTPGVDFALKLKEEFTQDSAREFLRGFDVARDVIKLDEFLGVQADLLEQFEREDAGKQLAEAVA